ncbi:MAG: phosphatase PAP2 family protein [Elusimicrobiales bacterium]
MFPRRELLAVLLPLLPLSAAAQDHAAASPRHWPGDAGQIITSPRRWDRGDLGRAGLAAAGVGLSLLWLDGDLRGGGGLEGLTDRAAFLGDPYFNAAALGAVYAYGAARGSGRVAAAGLAGLESWAISGAIVVTAKAVLRRERPSAGVPRWRSGGGDLLFNDELSFPSGHAAAAFSSARVAAWYLDGKPAAPYVCYGLAGLAAWSRVEDGDHWVSDVVAGAAIGYFTADKVLKLSEARRPAGGAALLPVYGGGPGLTAVYRF